MFSVLLTRDCLCWKGKVPVVVTEPGKIYATLHT